MASKKKTAEIPEKPEACQAAKCADRIKEAAQPENKNQVSERHRAEWRIFRIGILEPVYESRDPDAAKFAKAIADILKVYQEGERRAWGFADPETDNNIEVSWEG